MDVSRERCTAWQHVRRRRGHFRGQASAEGSCWSQLRIARVDYKPSIVADLGLGLRSAHTDGSVTRVLVHLGWSE